MKYIPLLCFAFMFSCGKKEDKKATDLPKEIETEMYTLETKNFFIDLPKEYDLQKNYFKTENLICINSKSDSVTNYFLTNWDNDNALIISFFEDFINLDSLDYIQIKENPEILNKKYGFKLKTPKYQLDTVLGAKKIDFITSTNHFLDKDLNENIFFINLDEKKILLSISKNNSKYEKEISDLDKKIIQSIILK